MTASHCLLGNISKIYIASAQSPIFRLQRIYYFATAHPQLFMNCKLTNYYTTGNRLHNCLLCIEKFYGNFQTPIWKHINDLYCYCAKAQFLATAHLSLATAHLPIICLLQIDQLFHHWKSSKYLITLH